MNLSIEFYYSSFNWNQGSFYCLQKPFRRYGKIRFYSQALLIRKFNVHTRNRGKNLQRWPSGCRTQIQSTWNVLKINFVANFDKIFLISKRYLVFAGKWKAKWNSIVLKEIIFVNQFALRKICQNTGFFWLLISRTRTDSTILFLYEKIRVRENLYFGLFSTM